MIALGQDPSGCVPASEKGNGRGFVDNATSVFLFVRYPSGVRRLAVAVRQRFLRFEKNYRATPPIIHVITTDLDCYEEVMIRIPAAVTAGIVTQAEADNVERALAKTPEQMEIIRDRIRQQNVLTAKAHEQADRDAKCIGCISNWHDVFGIPTAAAKAMCGCDPGFWPGVLRWGAIGLGVVVIAPVLIRAIWRVATR